MNICAEAQNRTADTVIFSHVLYQLSYLGITKNSSSFRYYCQATPPRYTRMVTLLKGNSAIINDSAASLDCIPKVSIEGSLG